MKVILTSIRCMNMLLEPKQLIRQKRKLKHGKQYYFIKLSMSSQTITSELQPSKTPSCEDDLLKNSMQSAMASL